MKNLLKEIRNCTVCEPHLDLGANPILALAKNSKILLMSQAPGRIAHIKNKAWDDPSGKILRDWLNVDEATFYNTQNFGILPTGFCYPGKGKSGDLPPRKECAPLWHPKIFEQLENVQLKISIGSYAQNYYLNDKNNLTEKVLNFENYLPEYFVLPHPSPRNRFWQVKNPWFLEQVIPELQKKVQQILHD